MRTYEILRAWHYILRGKRPALSLEITRECPLRCPGCYAYEPFHLGGEVKLRDLADYQGDELITRVLELTGRLRPLHVSIVGGDPLVRYRELAVLVPKLTASGIHVQVVTSAFRPLPAGWADLRSLTTVVSVDGLPAEHDERRKPATYERILRNIAGGRVTVHCTITALMTGRRNYLRQFLNFWTARPEVERVWFSLFSPQRGQCPPEALSSAERQTVVAEIKSLSREFPKLEMPGRLVREFERPPQSPEKCLFAQTTSTLSADLVTPVTPCQLGGDPDCSQCGCYASMGLAAIGRYRIGGLIPVQAIFNLSAKIGARFAAAQTAPADPNPLRVLNAQTALSSARTTAPPTASRR